MSLNRKIEEIRQKPEKERMRYVQIAVFVSMLLIVIIWLISFTLFGRKNNKDSIMDILQDENINSLEEQKDPLKNTTEQLKGAKEQVQDSITGTSREGFETN